MLDPDGGRYAVVARSDLLALPAPWELVGYEYSAPFDARAAAWQSRYRLGGLGAVLQQGGPDMLLVDWERESFKPLLLTEGLVHGKAAVLYTFEGEQGRNHVLAWGDTSDAAWLQVMGAAAAKAVLALGDTVGAHPAP